MRPLLKVALREYRAFRTDWPVIVLAVCMPLLFTLAIGTIYSHKKITDMPVTIVDQDHSELSRDLTRALLANETFTLGQYADSPLEFPELAARNRSHICFVFPCYLERDVKAGRGAKVAVLVDSTNMLAGNVALTAASEVLGTYSVGIDIHKTEARALAPTPWASQAAQPVVARQRNWFNSAFNSNYVNFMVLGLILIPVQLAPLLVVCHSGAREFEGEVAGQASAITRNPWLLIAGKCLPYVSVMWPVGLISIHIPHWWFGVPMVGKEWFLALVTLCFVMMLVTLGFGFSALTRDPVFSSELSALLTLPNFLLSGFTWPNFAMPAGIRLVSYAFPMYHFAFAARKIVLMGSGWNDCTVEIGIWWVWMVGALILARLGARAIMHGRRLGGACS